VRLLYQAALAAVRDARRHLAAGNIRERARAITRAGDILFELAGSLDHERGGEISPRLAHLYDYMQRRLTDANLRQQDQPLTEVLGLLTTLAEAWEGLRQQESAALEAAPVSPWAQAPFQEAAAAGSAHGWSF
jgi:flagellar secretion chaperone FliS